MEYSKDSFSQKQLTSEAQEAHVEASRVAKLGKKLVGKTVGMVEKGQSTKRIRSAYLFMEWVDEDDVTLALNAELKEQNIPIAAQLVVKWNGSIGDPAYAYFLELGKINGETVEVAPTPGWRD